MPDTDPRTETGQVGAAFNRMLGHMQTALARRNASETRLRRFAADASHELRTPLASIRGYAELALRHPGAAPETVTHALSRVLSESTRMTVLVDDLLLLARLDAGRPLGREPVDMSRVAIDAASDARVARPGHRWVLDLPDDPVVVHGDEHRLQQVLVNLLSNASRHTPEGTTVSVKVSTDALPNAELPDGENADQALTVRRGTLPPPPWMVLTVTDDGPGIAPELVPDLFERFTRADTARSHADDAPSTGLGLAIVDAVVAAHQGSVAATSRPGMTRFTIVLPRLAEPGDDPRAAPAPGAQGPALCSPRGVGPLSAPSLGGPRPPSAPLAHYRCQSSTGTASGTCAAATGCGAAPCASDTLHVDDTPVPVLAPGTGKTKTGRLWTYVRDERPFARARPPAALFFYSPDRKGEHPQAHLTDFHGVIHADGYAGFNELFTGGRIVEAACWAHVRRKFFDVHAATASPIAKEALDRIGQLYAVEKAINGSLPDRRRQERQRRSKPIAEALSAWAESTVRQLSRKSELAQAFRYMRARWTALVRCFDDGRLALDNNPAERALRCVAIGRKNYLFAGSDAGGRRAAAIYALIESAKLNGLDPQHYLADVLARIADHPARRIAELLPWNWQAAGATRAAA